MIESFFVGTLVGAVVVCVLAMRMISSALIHEEKRLAKIVETLKENKSIPAKVEEVNGIFYVYAVDKNEFLAQGSDSQEILAHLNFRMPNAEIRVIEGEPDVIQKLKATLPVNQ